LGCGTGFISRKLVDKNEVYGVDVLSESLKCAKEAGIRVKRWDVRKGLPYRSEMFDIVLATEILEHVFDTDALLSEIWRVLKKGGILVVSVPNVCSLKSRINVVLGGLPSYVEYHCRKGTAGHIRGYNLPAIKSQLEEHGFRIEEVRTNAICFGGLFVPWRRRIFAWRDNNRQREEGQQ